MSNIKFECKSCVKEPTDRINVGRFIDKLDSFFKTNDLVGAGKHIEYWENAARSYNDTKGLLAVLNEELGFYRRTNEKDKGLKAVEEVISIINDEQIDTNISSATILLNAATTYKAFGYAEKALPVYDIAQKVYEHKGIIDTYEYAALLNNKATSLNDLNRYDEAEKCFNEAIEILKNEGKHDGEIAVSLISLAHLYFDRDDTAYELVEKTIDEAWEYINSPRQPRDANYAYILTKLAPSYRYFKRELEANALEEVAKEIYGEE